MNYITIYEHTVMGSQITNLLPLIFFFIIGVIVVFSVKRYYKTFSLFRQVILFIGYVFGAFSFIFLVVLLIKAPGIIKDKGELKKMIENNSFLIVEGVVENFVPPEVGYSHFECFTVNSVSFKYSDYNIVDGFHQTSKNNGPINKNGQQVRIGYTTVDKENLILKLEIMK
jgi:hypothetical protein